MPAPSKVANQSKPPQTAPSRSVHSDTPPDSPAQPLSTITLTSSQFQQLLDTVKQAAGGASDSGPASGTGSSTEKDSEKKNRIRASKLEFKTVNEVWNKKTYKHEIKESLQSSEEEDEYEEYIFVHRRKFDSKNMLEASFVDVKSTTLRDILREVLEGVTCVSLREDKPSINPDILFTYLPEQETYREKNTKPNSTERLHLDKLIEFLKAHYASTSEKLNALVEHKEITFELLKFLFQPGSIVFMVSADSEQPRCLIFDSGQVKATDNKMTFELSCRYNTYDGKVFGETALTTHISEFHGVMKISSLGVHPLEYHAEKQKIADELIERGRKYISLIGIHCRTYQGMAFFIEKREIKKIQVTGRVMIDAVSFREKNPSYFFPRINEKSTQDSSIDLGFSADDDSSSEEADSGNGGEVTKRKTSYTKKDLLLCNPTVFGFSLSTKIWAEFAVANLEEFHWDSFSFDSVVMAQDRKDIIRALVERYVSGSNKKPFDVIRGKGQSLVILLHGPPGVGKTLTAEAISETKEMPLYDVCAGDLGNDAEHLEHRLSEITSLAHKWKAVILLDEADVYLEQRSLQDIRRNGLVSVFLRHLEYFQGIMFLTTDRVTTFDDAFQSRIHFAMKFGDLSTQAKKKIWNNSLEKVPPTEKSIKDKEVDGLSTKNINGRQIRNCVRIASDLAAWKGQSLSVQHLETTVAANKEFEIDHKGAGSIENMNSYT